MPAFPYNQQPLDGPSLSRALARTGVVGVDARVYRETGSTNDDLKEWAGLGAADWSVVAAECQTGGRGRRGRPWASPPGLNLYLSVLTPRVSDPAQWPRIPILAGVAAGEALAAWGLAVRLKWPNDLLAPSGAKLGGLLMEQADGHRGVVGLGLNVNGPREECVPGGGSLHSEFGDLWDRSGLAAAFLERFQAWWRTFQADGFAPVAEAWETRALWLGQSVRALGESGEWTGRMKGIDPWGRLRLASAEGELLLPSGDISLRAK